MALETGTFLTDLVATNPAAGDGLQQGDDHLRLIKTVLKNTFPNADAAMSPSAGAMNMMVGTANAVRENIGVYAGHINFSDNPIASTGGCHLPNGWGINYVATGQAWIIHNLGVQTGANTVYLVTPHGQTSGLWRQAYIRSASANAFRVHITDGFGNRYSKEADVSFIMMGAEL